jgi:hypothetical protein
MMINIPVTASERETKENLTCINQKKNASLFEENPSS